MRLRERDLSAVYLKRWQEIEDDEGNSIKGYSDEAIELRMNVQSAGGQIAATLYGSELPYIKECMYQGGLLKPNRNENDGICLDVKPTEQPDYFIKSIQPFSTHLNITLKRI